MAGCLLLLAAAWMLASCSLRPPRSVEPEPFTFVQLCDPQLGMGGYEQSVASFETAVERINALGPAFVVVCGDLVNTPNEPSIADFKRVVSGLTAPVRCAAGNHDVGATPDAASLALYRETFGPDYHAFTHEGVEFVIVNTQFWKAPVEGESERHDAWVREALAVASREGRPVIVVGHFPVFLETPDEKDDYFNLPRGKRGELLRLFEENGVVAVLTGHVHRLLINEYNGMQLVTGETTSSNFDKRPLGFRLWTVDARGSARHEFVPLESADGSSLREDARPGGKREKTPAATK